MARIAALCFSLTLLLGASGCTWTETRSDYPPEVAADGHHHHAQPPEFRGDVPPMP
ncbi:hypothetical protein OJF2_72870 [Aquisphaera giovannonii]|uniref:Lipoprotein n=1 Tax=Aquisphaera giovannonii TaxID=406548 RepID=A0A5B9WFD7_9BACT|nr:hypothetical protein [Aquisphaera giovannonii]QEH38681.1 hypothetical protein OJF2_72870 [Aquisphaera giovannonii]